MLIEKETMTDLFVVLLLIGFSLLMWGLLQSLQPADGGIEMNGFVILAGVIALSLLFYLFISLIKPEWFG